MNITEIWNQRDSFFQKNQQDSVHPSASKINVHQINQEYSINGHKWKPAEESDNLDAILSSHGKAKKGDYNPFKAQYFNMYEKRLEQLREALRAKLEKVYRDELNLMNTTQLKVGEKCTIIGCISKVFKNESSYIEVLEDPQMCELFPKFEKFDRCDQDKVYIED